MLHEIIDVFLGTRRRLAIQFVKFAAVGAFNTVLDFAVYLGLTRSSAFWSGHIVWAATVSFTAGVTSSFILNNFWTFRADASGWRRRAPKFLAVALGGLLWNDVILHLLTQAGLHDIQSKLVATAIVLFWNFTLQKTWTFRT